MTQGEKGFDCSNSPGSTHFHGCACHEARWESRLAASEARVRALEGALRHATRELQYIADDDPCHRLHQTEEGLACIRLAESLLGHMRGWPEEPNATQATGFRVWKVAARLAPPPEAEKKGGE